MAKAKRTQTATATKIKKSILDLDNKSLKVGFFESARYADGTPVAYVASIQEFGVSFTHPGGTSYVIGEDGMARFVSNDFTGPVMGVTQPHEITIPPRPFMRTTAAEKQTDWIELMRKGGKAVINGNETVESVLNKIGLLAAGQIGETIAALSSPALKPGTVKARQRKMADGKSVGNLTKPLVESGILINSPTHLVE